MSSDKLPLLSFSNPAAFKRWLATQPLNSQGAWLKFAKKGAAKATLNKSDAIDLALAHGWIDGQLGSVDEFYFKTRFTPRKPKSKWSKINCERVKKLIELGQMTQQGLAQVDAAKADGRWEKKNYNLYILYFKLHNITNHSYSLYFQNFSPKFPYCFLKADFKITKNYLFQL